MTTWIPVVIESPYSGAILRNLRYLQRAIRDCISKGETPYASHQMLTDAMNDLDPADRAKGIEAGFAFRALTKKTVVYEDYGYSGGMRAGMEHALEIGHPVEVRRIGREEDGLLKLWNGGDEEYVIAADEMDAAVVWSKVVGMAPTKSPDWSEMRPDLPFVLNDESKLVSEWIAEKGRCYFAHRP